MGLLREVVLTGFVTLLLPTSAQASAMLVVDANGILTGAAGVLVNGHLFDVGFVEGTCTEVFGVCAEAHFAFTTEATALAAAKALIDQVFLDVAGLGDFDSDPMLTLGCFFPANCWALTPYEIMGSNFLITQALNSAAGSGSPDGYFVHQPGGPGLEISGYDASSDINGVLAKWTLIPDASVADPTFTILLFGSSLASLVVYRSRRPRL